MEFENKIKSLPIWKNLENIEPLEGGITNLNFLVSDSGSKSVVRLGSDIPEHLVYRSNEIIVSEAAYQIGVSPKLIYNEPGVLVLEFIESKTLEPKTVRENLNKIVPIIRKIHDEIPNKLSGQPQIFWVFYVIKYYSNYLLNNNSSHISLIPSLLKKAEKLEKLSSPREIVFGHNDLLAANFLDDGSKIWVVDWEYGGFNDPLFDIGGLSSNNDLDENLENEVLEMYFKEKPSKDLIIKYNAMKTASLLRETMWSMVSEITSKIEFNYAEYTSDNLKKFEESFDKL
ncbi:MAG: choline kinase [Pelagibacteraceae bacterium]|jgi:thiamine kinase-like enzyme|nr:MAG: choline kinase [Pelagibacteraceae bacterium]|tara:strand:- start:2557 stop:3414 length:858 start_codon:yes stop_codon:yes gene_type:complete